MNEDQTPNPSLNQPSAPDAAPISNPTPNSSNTANIKHATRTRLLLITAGAVVLALIGFGVYAVIQANTKKNDQALINNNTKQEPQKTAPTNGSDTITTVLPNGKTATYANTEANQNLLFSSSDKGANYVNISSKAIANYIAGCR